MKQLKIHYLSPIEVQITSEGRQIFLLGTAHVSKQSAQQTEAKIAELQPDCICIELDAQRYESLRQKERWQNLDLFKTLKEGKGFLLLTNLLLSSFQKRIGRDLEMKPGQEMIRAMELAELQKVHLELVDRPVEVTLRRAWSSCSIWQRAKLLNALLASLFASEEISEDDIEGLKEADSLEHIMNEFANYLPNIKTCLIDERDVFLARSIADAPGSNVFAVLGAGHLRGVCDVLERIYSQEHQMQVSRSVAPVDEVSDGPASEASEEAFSEMPSETLSETSAAASSLGAGSVEVQTMGEKPVSEAASGVSSFEQGAQVSQGKASRKVVNLPQWLRDSTAKIPAKEQLLRQPSKSKLTKVLPWLIPCFAVAIMAAGFFFGDSEKALHGLGIWALSHSVLAGLAALLVLAHPLSILVAVLASPFTALNPTISVGLVTALAEVLLRQPRVGDLENLLELEKWWQFRKNRIWHALIIFFVVSMGGAVATFIALPWLSAFYLN